MRIALVTLAVVMLLSGCASGDRKQREAAAAVPLSFDPTDKYQTPSWWTNGQELLHLDADGGYRLYPGTNRYARPEETGRWWQQSYAALWLEPYAQYGSPRTRCSIRKIDEDFVLEVRALEPMLGISLPPPRVEDRLIGSWSGPMGVLKLDGDLRYILSPRLGPSAPAAVASQDGRWLVEAETIVLRPDSPSIDPRYLSIAEEDGTLVLETEDGRLTRQESAQGNLR